MPKGIIFDLDGTLVDTRQDLATAINCMRADFSLPALPMETVVSFVGDGARNLVHRSLGTAVASLDEALACFKRHYTTHLLATTVCYPDVLETLERCRRAGIRCAVVTNKPEAPTRRILAQVGLLPFFDPIIGGDTTPYLKPDPHMMRCVLECWGLGPYDVVVVGDHDTDIVAAHRAGMKVVFLESGFGRRRDEAPDWTVGSMAELQQVLSLSCHLLHSE